MSSSRSKNLIKDVALFAIASFAPKLLSFFLVPLYTACLSTEMYGISDLLVTLTSLILPIMMLDISDAVMLYTIEFQNTEKENQPLRFGTTILINSTVILGVVSSLLFFLFKGFSVKGSYLLYVLLNYFILALYNNLLAYLRGKDKVNIIVISSIINSIVTLSSNIILIVYLKLGLNGLLISSILGTLVTNVYIIIKINFFTLIKETKNPNDIDRKKMLSYSIPLIFTGLAWWVNSSSDRLFITMFANIGINGIYAVANKIPTILSACHTIIYQAMQLSVFKEIHSEDKDEYLTRLYNIYSFGMFTVCSALIIMDKALARFLFKGEFYIAWKYSPALLISIVFFSIAGYLTTIYAAEKETKLIAKATVIGAIINSILNIFLIPKFELYGAVIATVIGYFVIWLIMAVNCKKITQVKLPLYRSVLCGLILLLQWILLLVFEKSYVVQIILFIAQLIINFEIIKYLIQMLKKLKFNSYL